MQLSLDQYAIGVLYGLTAAILFAATNVIFKSMSKEIRVLDINALRIWISLPFAFFVAILPIRPSILMIPAESILPLSFSMIVGIVVGDGFYFLSQERIGVARAFPIAMSYPLIVYALSAIFLGEPIIPLRIIGAVMVVLGIALITRGQVRESKKSEYVDERQVKIGIACAFSTAILWAVGDTVFQFGLQNIDPIDGNLVRMLAGSIVLIPAVAISLKGGRQFPSKKVTGLTLIIGLFGMGVSLLLGTFSVKYIGATATSILVASAPIFTTPLSVYYLKEELTMKIGLGTLLTVLGVMLVILFH